MTPSGTNRRLLIAGWILSGLLFAGQVVAGTPIPANNPMVLLKQADSIKLSDQALFTQILDQLDDVSTQLSPNQLEYLHYLQGWEAGYHGDYETSDELAHELLDHAQDETLRFRAGVLLVNTLSERSRFEEAFQRESRLLAKLPDITDPDARGQALVVAAYLYEEAGQYELAFNYADQVFRESPGSYSCKVDHARLAALYKSGRLDGIDEQLARGIELCNRANDILYSNSIRYYEASLALRRGQSKKAIEMLKSHYAEVKRSKYQQLISQFDALLAQAYLDAGDPGLARQSALAVVAQRARNKSGEPLSVAYKVLYQLEKQQGNLGKALDYHEKYQDANKGYLNAVNARALAYQTVQQQLVANKLQVETLGKQNKILQLQQTLNTKASETSRLYIILLITVLAFIAFWAYRVKRSQLRFMKLARRDGLTGIYNRQHFINEVELQLKYCRKSSREVCLVLLDLDHFKAVNDTYGHATGDQVLKNAVAACQAHLRSSDIFGRLGGEEFGIVLPDCSLQRVVERVELIRRAISTSARRDEQPDLVVSASFGVASTAHTGYEMRDLLVAADDALYRAKRDGRNRVRVSDGVEFFLRSV